MGRDGRGVRAVSDTSIEITFMYRGVRCRERITLKPSPTDDVALIPESCFLNNSLYV
ncbi:Arm DNA-binding domain-containing protein [Pseudomonas syringae]|uniref:Arm DNA-binding domain-containing protein n=1 Tax=Pseudomonas syringae TaxID=317 RepID=UPI003F8CC4C9